MVYLDYRIEKMKERDSKRKQEMGNAAINSVQTAKV